MAYCDGLGAAFDSLDMVMLRCKYVGKGRREVIVVINDQYPSVHR